MGIFLFQLMRTNTKEYRASVLGLRISVIAVTELDFVMTYRLVADLKKRTLYIIDISLAIFLSNKVNIRPSPYKNYSNTNSGSVNLVLGSFTFYAIRTCPLFW